MDRVNLRHVFVQKSKLFEQFLGVKKVTLDDKTSVLVPPLPHTHVHTRTSQPFLKGKAPTAHYTEKFKPMWLIKSPAALLPHLGTTLYSKTDHHPQAPTKPTKIQLQSALHILYQQFKQHGSKIFGGKNSRKQSLSLLHTGNYLHSIYMVLRRTRWGFDPWVRKIPWKRAWQPTPVFLPEKSPGQRSLAGYGSRGRKESDTTEQPTLSLIQY